jgi:hypothetical protein
MDPVLAKLVWPALYLEGRLFTWWAIGTGLAVEYRVVRQLTGLPPRKTLLADVTMNDASALAGLVLLPLAGVVWELFPGSLLYRPPEL